uniref:Uncharacterized protein n=1 Tax=Rhodosorus marinus TaxID=101924 RepID=A0A7S3A6F3_9RHOD
MVLESWNRCWPEDTLLVICKRTASNSRRVDMRYREYQNAQEPTAGAVLSPNSTPAFRSSLKTSRLTKFAPIYRLIVSHRHLLIFVLGYASVPSDKITRDAMKS